MFLTLKLFLLFSECPTEESPYYASFGNTCYYFDTVERTILEARLNCIDNHGKLWEPKTLDRMNQIQIKGMEFATQTMWWVGITDEQNEGNFYYYSNLENFNFTPNSAPWREDEPNGGTAENCVSMGRTIMVFFDIKCNEGRKATSICEYQFDGPSKTINT